MSAIELSYVLDGAAVVLLAASFLLGFKLNRDLIAIGLCSCGSLLGYAGFTVALVSLIHP